MSRPTQLEAKLAPFAYASDGRLLATADLREVLVRLIERQGPTWSHRFATRASRQGQAPTAVFRMPAEQPGRGVVGVRACGQRVYAVDDRGTLKSFTPEGRLIDTVHTQVRARALLADPSGVWAVVHARGAVLGRGARILRRVEEREVACGAFGDGGVFLSLGTNDGRLVVTPVERGGPREIELGAAPRDLAWGGRHGWIVARGDAVIRVDSSYRNIEPLWLADELGELSGVTCSADGRMCAFRRGEHRVDVHVLADRSRLARLEFESRKLGELAFGPWPWLGVGLGLGEYGRVDLESRELEIGRADARRCTGEVATKTGQRRSEPIIVSATEPSQDQDQGSVGGQGAGALVPLAPRAVARVSVNEQALEAERLRALRERSEPIRQFVFTLALFATALFVLVRLLLILSS